MSCSPLSRLTATLTPQYRLDRVCMAHLQQYFFILVEINKTAKWNLIA